MPFLKKSTCMAPQALSLEDCPLENMPHMPSYFPIYSDALYFPQLHPLVFETPYSFCWWLSTAVKNCQSGLHACSCMSLTLPLSIDHIDRQFCVTFGQHSRCLLTADVESCLLMVCWILRQLLTIVDPPFEKAKDILLNDNPTCGCGPLLCMAGILVPFGN